VVIGLGDNVAVLLTFAGDIKMGSTPEVFRQRRLVFTQRYGALDW
jgi:hypothetical protein